VNRKKLFQQLQHGALRNKNFLDILSLAEGFGFRQKRVSGSHYIYIHPEVPEPLNFQDENGEAKAYQIRQLLKLVKDYNLKLED
jgi:hypothetical protein